MKNINDPSTINNITEITNLATEALAKLELLETDEEQFECLVHILKGLQEVHGVDKMLAVSQELETMPVFKTL